MSLIRNGVQRTTWMVVLNHVYMIIPLCCFFLYISFFLFDKQSFTLLMFYYGGMLHPLISIPLCYICFYCYCIMKRGFGKFNLNEYFETWFSRLFTFTFPLYIGVLMILLICSTLLLLPLVPPYGPEFNLGDFTFDPDQNFNTCSTNQYSTFVHYKPILFGTVHLLILLTNRVSHQGSTGFLKRVSQQGFSCLSTGIFNLVSQLNF